jgi:tetratricopeptide (TPR) repeat protein
MVKTTFLLRLLALVLALIGLQGAARAQGGVPGLPDDFMRFNAREMQLLPPYCRYSEYFRHVLPDGYNPTQTQHWRDMMGAPFNHIHHYCFGMIKTNRAMFWTVEQHYRTFYLRDAIKEFDYVLERVPKDFVLVPEILTKRGENLVRLGQGPIAVLDFEKAIDTNPGYWPPYAQLSDYYAKSGDVDKARKTLEDGLKSSPDASGLQRRLAALSAPAKAAARSGGEPPKTP